MVGISQTRIIYNITTPQRVIRFMHFGPTLRHMLDYLRKEVFVDDG